jgi:hypothetical protein
MPEHSLEWRKLNKIPRFAWKSTTCPEYIKDRDNFFKQNGNGWWWLVKHNSSRKKVV